MCCINCKYIKEIKGKYCYCKKKLNTVLMSKQENCKHFLSKIVDK